MPEVPHPIPSRTRSLSPPGSMVLRLKARESRSLPGLPGLFAGFHASLCDWPPPWGFSRLCPNHLVAGWSSPVARQAHNLKVVGSNPAPAPKSFKKPRAFAPGLLCVSGKIPQALSCSCRKPASVAPGSIGSGRISVPTTSTVATSCQMALCPEACCSGTCCSGTCCLVRARPNHFSPSPPRRIHCCSCLRWAAVWNSTPARLSSCAGSRPAFAFRSHVVATQPVRIPWANRSESSGGPVPRSREFSASLSACLPDGSPILSLASLEPWAAVKASAVWF
jgi:hypothetical protein